MTQPIKNSLIESPQTVKQTAAQKVFEMPDLLSRIFNRSQERALSQVNKATREENQMLTNSSWQEIRRAATADHLEGPTVFQKRHPTLSSFIQSNQIKNHSQLVAHLRKEAQDLALTGTEIFRTFKTSLASKDILALDAFIEQTNFEKVNGYNFLWSQLGVIERPEKRDYEAWNEAVQAINVTTVTDLNIQYHNLTRIPYGILHLRNLQSLSLSYNQLAILPPQIGQLQNLQSLYLNDNQLAALPEEIGQLQHLESLYLDSNQLAALPEEIEQLRNLGILSLDRNKLTVLTPQIGQLKKLRSLSLQVTQLAALPQEIGQLQNLLYLSLGYNELTVLPPQIGQLKNLRSLSLVNNQLAALPQEIGQLQNLQGLFIRSNKLTALPESFARLIPQLERGSNEIEGLVEAGRKAGTLEKKS